MEEMNKIKKYLLSGLLLVCLCGMEPAAAQFIRTRIFLPAGVEISRGDMVRRIYPEGTAAEAKFRLGYIWLEIKGMENLHLLAEYRDAQASNQVSDSSFSSYTAGIIDATGRADRKLSMEDMLLLNDGSENFATAVPMIDGAFVLRENPLRTTGINREWRMFSAWMGIPLEAGRYTVIHYP